MEKIDTYFTSIDPKVLTHNFFQELDNNWALLTAGNKSGFNMMTVSWGTLGILWNLPVAIVYCRPQRYTFEFLNDDDAYTLSFLHPEHRHILQYCGSHSGRNADKIKATGLESLITANGNIGYKQGKLILECKIIYADNIKESHFIDKSLIQNVYPTKDFHRFFIGRIEECYLR